MGLRLRISGLYIYIYVCVCVFTHVNTSYRFLHHVRCGLCPSSNIRQPEHMVQVGWSIGLS